MRPRFLAVFFCVSLLALAGTSIAQPVPLSASPDEARLMELYPALRDARAAGGGIVLIGVDQFGCAEGALQIEYVVIISDPTQAYVLNTVVRNNGLVRMNQRVPWIFPSGQYEKSIAWSDTGGPSTNSFPLAGDATVTIEMIFSEGSGRPLWYSKMDVADCNGTPSTTSGFVSTAVMLLNKNPTFQPNTTSPAVASKWTPSGKVAYSCAPTGVCTQKFTGKAGKVASISQHAKIKPALADGTRIGAAIVFDASAAINGKVVVAATTSESGTDNDLTYTFELFEDGQIFLSDAVFMPHVAATSGAMNLLHVEVRFEDTPLGGQAASGKVKVTGLYVFAVAP